MSNKAQAQIIGFILLTAMILSIISATYYWMIPKTREITSLNEVHRMEDQMLYLNNAIINTVREKSQRSILFKIKKGNLRVLQNRIIYKGFFTLPKESRVSEKIIYGGINTSNYINCSEGAVGILGEDEFMCLLERKSIELELRYFKLNDTSTGDLYQINFVPSNKAFIGEGNHQVMIKWYNETINGTNPRTITENVLIEFY